MLFGAIVSVLGLPPTSWPNEAAEEGSAGLFV